MTTLEMSCPFSTITGNPCYTRDRRHMAMALHLQFSLLYFTIVYVLITTFLIYSVV